MLFSAEPVTARNTSACAGYHPSGNSSFDSHIPLKILVFGTLLPNGITNNPPCGRYGCFLEPHKLCKNCINLLHITQEFFSIKLIYTNLYPLFSHTCEKSLYSQSELHTAISHVEV